MIQIPPRSTRTDTLFPYTALFRSVDTAKVRCPVYIVSCGKDRLTPASVVRKLAKRYPQAAQRHYAERGHWVIDDEETEEMMHAICGWLRPSEQRIERAVPRSEEHTSELQSLMRISYAVFCLKKKKTQTNNNSHCP